MDDTIPPDRRRAPAGTGLSPGHFGLRLRKECSYYSSGLRETANIKNAVHRRIRNIKTISSSGCPVPRVTPELWQATIPQKHVMKAKLKRQSTKAYQSAHRRSGLSWIIQPCLPHFCLLFKPHLPSDSMPKPYCETSRRGVFITPRPCEAPPKYSCDSSDFLLRL